MFSLLLALSATLQEPEAKPKPADAPASAAKSDEAEASTPEAALRAFLVAMVVRDEPALKKLVLDPKDLEWLLKAEAPPADQVEAIRAQLARMPVRTLKEGEEVELPGGRKIEVQARDVTGGRAMLVAPVTPVPLKLRSVEGRWRVDAAPIAAARKAAEAARKSGGR